MDYLEMLRSILAALMLLAVDRVDFTIAGYAD
ncbi:hypothetical protein ABIF21_000788 [Bradyrhizobium elkanii]|nr:hypothetical protein [Bradyrhizobium elkanii]MCW2111213.1 hypothetical protein [Bradyrhizobium elkanii]MCW2227939.1 hypothetical protein [Bradyrhizobium elkanii]